ncbi:MAG: c-type cytochrome [Blastocatellia bacterium]|nr:c-type cytochrome [Blastocatellia bacterium]
MVATSLQHLRQPKYLIGLIVLLTLATIIWLLTQPIGLEKLPDEPAEEIGWTTEPIQPIPIHLVLDQRKVQLGARLFSDPILSRDEKISCASCHDLQAGGADAKAFSIGIQGAVGTINTPTVFNSHFNSRLNWTGAFETLEEHLDTPLLNPTVMGASWDDVLHKLQRNAEYRHEFSSLYPHGLSVDAVRDALTVFQKSLYTPNSRFDRYLRGDATALTAEEQEGYRLFKSYGCVSCHQGINVGGNMFQKFGVLGDYFVNRGNLTKTDTGRFQLTGKEEDRFVFRVPSLRNVAVTGPYFHDGKAETLDEAITVMSTYQLGRSLSTDQIRCIKSFLESLTGEYQGKPLKAPVGKVGAVRILHGSRISSHAG